MILQFTGVGITIWKVYKTWHVVTDTHQNGFSIRKLITEYQ
jgi:hypothetical protein